MKAEPCQLKKHPPAPRCNQIARWRVGTILNAALNVWDQHSQLWTCLWKKKQKSNQAVVGWTLWTVKRKENKTTTVWEEVSVHPILPLAWFYCSSFFSGGAGGERGNSSSDEATVKVCHAPVFLLEDFKLLPRRKSFRKFSQCGFWDYCLFTTPSTEAAAAAVRVEWVFTDITSSPLENFECFTVNSCRGLSLSKKFVISSSRRRTHPLSFSWFITKT